jgi:hypothetical protein
VGGGGQFLSHPLKTITNSPLENTTKTYYLPPTNYSTLSVFLVSGSRDLVVQRWNF